MTEPLLVSARFAPEPTASPAHPARFNPHPGIAITLPRLLETGATLVISHPWMLSSEELRRIEKASAAEAVTSPVTLRVALKP